MWGKGFLQGLRITMRNFFRGPITLKYPEEKRILAERSRWALAQNVHENGRPKCTACTICVGACPDGIITLDWHKTEEGGKHIDRYEWEMGACMFCGLCVEACPFGAIRMSHDYELTQWDRNKLSRTLLFDVPAHDPKKAAAEEKAAEEAKQTAAQVAVEKAAVAGVEVPPVEEARIEAAEDLAAGEAGVAETGGEESENG
jgi:NADH-quinone oxidoreductase subunit I